jgi:hypothetical protein
MPPTAATSDERPGCELVARVVRQCLREGHRVEIDGLGTFVPDGGAGFRFEAGGAPKVFLAYVQEDARAAARLYSDLRAAGCDPWLDRRKLLAGQNWPRAIEEAIDTADFFVACFSRNSERKRGGFQAEIRYALDCARRVPLDEVFLVPVRLEDCRVPRAIGSELQYIDLFPGWRGGLRRLIAALRRGCRRRGSAVRF